MKRLLIFVMSLMLVAPAAVCASEPALSWQEAFENAKRNTRRGITLKSYKVQGKIRSEARLEKLIDSWFENDAYLLSASVNDTDSNVSVSTILERKHANKIPNFDFTEAKKHLRQHLNEEMMIVKLCWDVNGKEYITRAVVSDIYDIVFDMIGSYVLLEGYKNEHKEVSGTEHKTTMRYYAVNIFGLTVYDQEMTFKTTFDKYGRIVENGCGISLNTGHIGWECISKPDFGQQNEIKKWSQQYNYSVQIKALGMMATGWNGSFQHSIKPPKATE